MSGISWLNVIGMLAGVTCAMIPPFDWLSWVGIMGALANAGILIYYYEG